jgi:hypothetical protein
LDWDNTVAAKVCVASLYLSPLKTSVASFQFWGLFPCLRRAALARLLAIFGSLGSGKVLAAWLAMLGDVFFLFVAIQVPIRDLP